MTPSYVISRSLVVGYEIVRLAAPRPDVVIASGLPSETTPLATLALIVTADALGIHLPLYDADSFIATFLTRFRVDRVCAVTVQGPALDAWWAEREQHAVNAEPADA